MKRAVVSLLCLVAAVCMRTWTGPLPWELWIPAGLLLATAVLIHGRHIGSQLPARAVLWSNLILAAMVASFGGHGDVPVAAVLGGATAASLLLLGRSGLERADAGFIPVAFRSTLVALMVMA